MNAIEFQTTVKEIVSAMPKDRRSELETHNEDEEVRVIVFTSLQSHPQEHKDLLRDAKQKGYTDFLEYLMDNPLDISDPIRFTREELHER